MAKKKLDPTRDIAILHKRLKESMKETDLAIERSAQRANILRATVAQEIEDYKRLYGDI